MSLKPRYSLFLLIVFLVLSSSCATSRIAPSIATDELDALRVDDYPPFTAIGSLKIEGGKNGGKATILLAGAGEKFRLQIIDPTGRVVLATAGAPGFLITVDPTTGEKTEVNGDKADTIHYGNVAIPANVITSLVTGSPPAFGSVTSAVLRGGKKIVKTKNPKLELIYTSTLESMRLLSGNKKITVTFGPMQKGAAIPYVSHVSLDFGVTSTTAKIKWKSVTHRQKMPEGFFTFNTHGVSD